MEPREAYIRAGKIAFNVLARGLNYIEEEVSVLEICEKVEGDIRRLGGEPAFPCNISQNEEAAHYTAAPNDKKVIMRGSLVKLDIGVHVEGFIADTAVTVGLSSKWDRIIEAARITLEEGLKVVKAGLRFSLFGKTIEEKASTLGFKTIENLAGHKLGRYLVHAGESVPNKGVASPGFFKVGTAYAIEPFLVDKGAAGYVVDKGHSNIFRLPTPRRVKDRALNEMIMEIWNKYKGLPFASRWIYNEFGEGGISKLKILEELKLVYEYPMLVEAEGNPVAQFEHTIFIDQDGSILIVTLDERVQSR